MNNPVPVPIVSNRAKPHVAVQSFAKPLTGKGVLLWLTSFFMIVFAVNGYMMRVAFSTFAGVDADNAYKAGLEYEKEIDGADTQSALGWKVTLRLVPTGINSYRLSVTTADSASKQISGLTADVLLVHPTDRRLDLPVKMTGTGVGSFLGEFSARPGNRDLRIELYKDGERQFRSWNRIFLKNEAPNG